MTRLDYWLTDNSANEQAQHDWDAAQEKLDAAIDACASDAELLELAGEVLGKHTRSTIAELLLGDSTTITESVLRWADK